MKKHIKEPISLKKPSTASPFAALALSAALLNQVSADTLKQGNIYNETWTAAASPYRLVDNCTVPSGYNLTIQPGVLVKINEGFSLTVYGQVFAEGSPSSGRITFRCTQAGKYWNEILIQNPNTTDSHLTYCDLTDATNALHLSLGGPGVSWTPQIANCTFSNCVGYGIMANSYSANLNVRISNSRFKASANGFYMYADGGSAGTSILIANSIFESIPGKAIWFNPHASMTTVTPSLVNNLFNQCGVAVDMKDNFDCALYNNLIQDSPLAIRTSGALSRNVYYNCLFNNQTNFIGYPSVYGRIDDVNRNGTPADAFMNITNNPLLCEVTNYTLSATSPCIDAGNPAGAYLDNCFAPGPCQPGALGTVINDIGLYGGTNCGWVVPPWNPTNFTLAAQRYFGAIVNPGVPGHYRIEWSPVVTGGTWTQATNVWLTNFPYIYIDYDSPSVSERFYRGVLLP